MSTYQWQILGLAICIVLSIIGATVWASRLTLEGLARVYDYWDTNRARLRQEISRLNAEAEAGATKQQALETQARADAKRIAQLEGTIAKLESESAMQQEIDMLNNVITNQQSRIDAMESRLRQRVSGVSLAEYAIVLAAVTAVVIVVFTPIGAWLFHRFSQIGMPFS